MKLGSPEYISIDEPEVNIIDIDPTGGKKETKAEMFERVVKEAAADVARRQKEVSDKTLDTYHRVLKDAGLSGEKVEVLAKEAADRAVRKIWGNS